jgi:bacterioferritin-associated ferredoxin
MYLCICKAVSDQQIRQAVEQGVRTLGDLSARFGVGIECGKCIDGIREFLDTCLAASPPVTVEATPLHASGDVAASSVAAGAALPPAAVAPDPQRAAWFAIDL